MYFFFQICKKVIAQKYCCRVSLKYLNHEISSILIS